MPGQVIRRGKNTWQVRVYAGMVGGTRKYPSVTVYGTRRDAEQMRTKMLRDRDQGSLAIPTRTTLREYLDKWKESSLRGRVSPRTFHGYEKNLERYVLPQLGEKRLTSLEPWDIQRAYQAMQDRGLSATTVRRTHAALHSALKQAVKWRIIPSSPADAVDLPKQTRAQHRPLTSSQARKFLEAADSSEWRALYHVLLLCGLRPGEAFGLTWPAVDLKAGRLAVMQAVTYDRDRKATLAEPKTASSRRSMSLPPETVRVLAEHRRRTADIASPMKLVFPNVNGGLIHPSHWPKREFRQLAKQAGAPERFRLYDLRHTCATLLLEAGEHPKVVSERLGHSSTKLTLDTYSHVTPTMQDGATRALAALVYAPGSEEEVRTVN